MASASGPARLALLLGKTAVGHERGIEVEVGGGPFRTAGRGCPRPSVAQTLRYRGVGRPEHR